MKEFINHIFGLCGEPHLNVFTSIIIIGFIVFTFRKKIANE